MLFYHDVLYHLCLAEKDLTNSFSECASTHMHIFEHGRPKMRLKTILLIKGAMLSNVLTVGIKSGPKRIEDHIFFIIII